MIDFRRILFPVTMSEQDLRTAPFVRAVARRFGSEIVVLHVEDFFSATYTTPDPVAPEVLTLAQELRQQRRAQFESFVASGFPGLTVRKEVCEGDPAHEIVAFVKSHDIGLIMMPTHAHGLFRRFLLGSVTAKVLHDVDCPVWTGVHTRELLSHDPERWERVLCAVDTDIRDARVVKWASEFAKQQGCDLRLAHAIPGAWRTDTENGPPFGEFLFRIAGEDMAKLQCEAGTSLPVVMRGGKPEHVVHEVAQEFKPDLIVIGRGELSHTLGRLRTHVYSIIRESPCPVISV